jgi:hypothetical protein
MISIVMLGFLQQQFMEKMVLFPGAAKMGHSNY